MPNRNNIESLHENLSKRVEGFAVPLDQFKEDMSNEEKRRNLHSNISKKFSEFTVPYDQFSEDIGFPSKKKDFGDSSGAFVSEAPSISQPETNLDTESQKTIDTYGDYDKIAQGKARPGDGQTDYQYKWAETTPQITPTSLALEEGTQQLSDEEKFEILKRKQQEKIESLRQMGIPTNIYEAQAQQLKEATEFRLPTQEEEDQLAEQLTSSDRRIMAKHVDEINQYLEGIPEEERVAQEANAKGTWAQFQYGFEQGEKAEDQAKKDTQFIADNLEKNPREVAEYFESEFRLALQRTPEDKSVLSAEGMGEMVGGQWRPILKTLGTGAAVGLSTRNTALARGASALVAGYDAAETGFGASFRQAYFEARMQGMDKEKALNVSLNQAWAGAAGGFVEGGLGAVPVFKPLGKFLAKAGPGREFLGDILDIGADISVAGISQLSQNIYAAEGQGLRRDWTEGVGETMLGEAIFSLGMRAPAVALKTPGALKKYIQSLDPQDQKRIADEVIKSTADQYGDKKPSRFQEEIDKDKKKFETNIEKGVGDVDRQMNRLKALQDDPLQYLKDKKENIERTLEDVPLTKDVESQLKKDVNKIDKAIKQQEEVLAKPKEEPVDAEKIKEEAPEPSPEERVVEEEAERVRLRDVEEVVTPEKEVTPETSRQFAIDMIETGMVSPEIDVLAPRVDLGMTSKERQKAINDIKAGNLDTAPAKKMLESLEQFHREGNVPIIQGTGGKAEKTKAITRQEQQDLIDAAKQELTEQEQTFAERVPDDIVEIIEKEGITSENFDQIREKLEGFPYSKEEFDQIKTHLDEREKAVRPEEVKEPVEAEPAEPFDTEEEAILQEDIDATLEDPLGRYIKTSKTKRKPHGPKGRFIEKPVTKRLKQDEATELGGRIKDIVTNPTKENYNKLYDSFVNIYESPFTGSTGVKKLWGQLTETFPEIEEAGKIEGVRRRGVPVEEVIKEVKEPEIKESDILTEAEIEKGISFDDKIKSKVKGLTGEQDPRDIKIKGFSLGKLVEKSSKETQELYRQKLEAFAPRAQRVTKKGRISRNILESTVERVSKAFPGLEVEYDPKMKTAGEFSKGKVKINPEKATADTVIHEFSHPFLRMMRQKKKSLFDKGKKLVEGTEYHKEAKEAYPDKSADEQLEEAMAIAIAEKGEGLFFEETKRNQTIRGRFKNWLKGFWGQTKRVLGVKKEIELENLTLDEFTALVAKDLLSKRSISEVTTKEFRKVETEGWEVGVEGGILTKGDSIAQKISDVMKEWFTTKGLMRSSVYAAHSEMKNKVSARMKKMESNIRDFRREINKLPREVRGETAIDVNDVLHGEKDYLVLPLPLRIITKRMRADIDGFSKQLIDIGAIDDKLEATINANMGVYLNRSYRVFDDPKWSKKIPQSVLNKAKYYIKDEYANIGQDLTQDEVDGLIQSILYKEVTPEGIMRGKSWHGKDLSILQKRKNIATPIRKLMGEHKDPLLNYSKTVLKQSRLVEGQIFLNKMKEIGLGNFLFEKPTGDFHVKIAAEKSKVLEPLNGLYTDKKLVKALEDSANDIEGRPAWLRYYMAANGLVKYSKTVASFQTMVRNFMSGVGFATINGHIDITKLPKAIKTTFNDVFRTTEKFDDYVSELIGLGVLDQDTVSGELKDVMKDASKAPEEIQAFSEHWGKKVMRRAKGIPVGLYRAGDNLWKVFGYENELNRYKEAYKDDKTRVDEAGNPTKKLKQEVADIITNTYPTYSKIPKIARLARRFPVVGTFVSFPAEILRNSANIISLGMKELKNPTTRSIGAKRMSGFAFTMIGTGAAALLSRMANDITEEDDKLFRRFVAPWTRNSQIIYLGRDEQGNINYIDLSYSDAYNYVKRPFTMLASGDDDSILKNTLEASIELLEPFLSEEILLKRVRESVSGKTDEGKPIYRKAEPLEDRLAKGMEHIWGALEPGTISSLSRVYKGLSGLTSDYGKKYDAGVEITAMLSGFRISKLDIEQSFFFKSGRYNFNRQDAKSIYNSVKNRKGIVSPEEINDAYETANKVYEDFFNEMSKDIEAALILGVPEKVIEDVMEKQGVPHSEIRNLMNNEFESFERDDRFEDLE